MKALFSKAGEEVTCSEPSPHDFLIPKLNYSLAPPLLNIFFCASFFFYKTKQALFLMSLGMVYLHELLAELLSIYFIIYNNATMEMFCLNTV